MMKKSKVKTDTVIFSAADETQESDDTGSNGVLSGVIGAISLAGILAACSPDGSQAPVLPPITTVTPAPVTTPAITVPTVTKTLTVPLSVWQNGIDYYKSGMYSIINNVWGMQDKSLVFGKDYYQNATYDPKHPNTNVKFEWNYPETLQGEYGSLVYAYPSVGWGNPLPLTGWENSDVGMIQIKNIKSLTQTYSVSFTGDFQNSSLLHDVWIFDPSGKVSGEIAFFSSPDDWTKYWNNPNGFFGKLDGAHTHTFEMNNVSYTVLVSKLYSPGSPQHGGMNFMITPTSGERINSGTIDWKLVFDLLVKDGDLNPDHYIRGIEMGAEIHMGDAQMYIHDFTVNLVPIDPMAQSLMTIG